MAVGHRLPNGYIVLLLTARESTLLRDQLLEPGEFPWDKTESQMVGMEVRQILSSATSEDSLNRLAVASQELMRAAQEAEQAQSVEAWGCPNCDTRNEITEEHRKGGAVPVCSECGYQPSLSALAKLKLP